MKTKGMNDVDMAVLQAEIASAIEAERKRCIDIVHLAREGETLRSIISRIKGGDSIEAIKAGK